MSSFLVVLLGSFPSITNEVMWAVNMQSVGGEFSKVDVSGWAFCETAYENDGKTLTVILKAQDRQQCWYTGALAGIRADVRRCIQIREATITEFQPVCNIRIMKWSL